MKQNKFSRREFLVITENFPMEGAKLALATARGERGGNIPGDFQLQRALERLTSRLGARSRCYFLTGKSVDPCLSSRRFATICLSF